MNEGSVFDVGLAARTAYGMGELHITPLQLCAMYTAYMNDGDILNPTVVKKISRMEGNEEVVGWENSRTVFKEDIAQSGTLERVKPSLRRVIEDGSAYTAQLQDVAGLVGKTGTANIGANREREVNWVVAINQSESKPYIYLVVVDTNEGEGTEPKLNILHGLVKPEGYAEALLGTVARTSQDGGTLPEGEPDTQTPEMEPVTTSGGGEPEE
jgi:penicillin-binding protein